MQNFTLRKWSLDNLYWTKLLKQLKTNTMNCLQLLFVPDLVNTAIVFIWSERVWQKLGNETQLHAAKTLGRREGRLTA